MTTRKDLHRALRDRFNKLDDEYEHFTNQVGCYIQRNPSIWKTEQDNVEGNFNYVLDKTDNDQRFYTKLCRYFDLPTKDDLKVQALQQIIERKQDSMDAQLSDGAAGMLAHLYKSFRDETGAAPSYSQLANDLSMTIVDVDEASIELSASSYVDVLKPFGGLEKWCVLIKDKGKAAAVRLRKAASTSASEGTDSGTTRRRIGKWIVEHVMQIVIGIIVMIIGTVVVAKLGFG